MIWTLIAIAAVMLAVERYWPASELPRVEGWWLRIALVNLAQLGIVLLAGATWDRWAATASLVHLSDAIGTVPAAFLAYFLSTLVYYGWHRVRHESTFFWRLCHQLHHSPRRIEVLASFYKHPVEITLNSMLSAVLLYTVLGCSLATAALYTALTALAEYFYHWNVRTPRWVGWWIQRPESHRIHHQSGHHRQNYADLPLWDWLFGTLHNPRQSPAHCGFTPEREARVAEMLLFRDVHTSNRPSLSPTCLGCRKRWACVAACQKD